MLKYYDITEAQLQAAAYAAESLYYCSDSGNIYLDSITEGKRVHMGNGFVMCATESALPLAPIPGKIYCILETGQMKTYYNNEWVILGGITQLHFANVVVENGSLTINNAKIRAKDTAQFIPDLSVIDLATNISCTCSEGSVRVTLTSSYPIPGEVIVN